jgi:hypothetical protein
MPIADDLREFLVARLRKAPSGTLTSVLEAMMAAGAIEDRRAEPRARNGASRTRKTTRRTCPAQGCRNAFSPRWGGWCADHRGTAGYKAWAAARPKAKTARVAKKR